MEKTTNKKRNSQLQITGYQLMAAILLLFAACDVKDPIYETSHPDKGEITVTTDWTGSNTAVPPSEGYVLAATDYKQEVASAVNTFNEHFAPGDYTLYAYNAGANNISVDGTSVTANYAGGTLGWFYSGTSPIKVEADSKQNFTVPMNQQVRELTIVINPEGDTADRVESITATLSGVAGTYNMADGSHGTATSVNLTFTKQTEGDYAGKWTATTRLLGITGSTQKLTGTITFPGDIPEDLPIESNLSADLSTFNNDKKTPLTLSGQADTHTGAGFTATISDWVEVDGGNVTAE